VGGAVSYGWLRPEVQIALGDAADCVRFAHWEVRLPKGAIATRTLHSVLKRDAPVVCPEGDQELAGLLDLLDAQGCFRRVVATDACSMRELRRRFERLRSAWYATYYAHPLWNRLRKGEASRNELLAWVIHNYHISRVAGAAAARCASRPYARDFRERFLEDTLDEYWHVNAYYFVKHPGLAVRDEDVKHYVPLAGSRAFELHTMQIADRNPLGHLLIACFQEATAVFLDDCVSFYLDVERTYGLPGFFDKWVAHMRLDIDQGHAGGLSRLLDNDRSVTPDEQLAALRCAYLAYRFLLASLDQVLEQARPDDSLDIRAPRDFVVGRPPVTNTACADRHGLLTAELLSSALQATLSCLGRTLEHDDVMALGRLCRALQPARTDLWLDCKASIWSEAISHLLQEHAADAVTLATLLRSLELRSCEHGVSYLSRDALDTIAHILNRHGSSSGSSLSLAISSRQAGEFLDLAVQSPLIDVEAYSP
jgi:hypothetical protein